MASALKEMKKLTDKEPHEALADFADKLHELAKEGKPDGFSTFILVTAYDPLNGDGSMSVRMEGNTMELQGAMCNVSFGMGEEE